MTRKVICEIECSKFNECRAERLKNNRTSFNDYDPHDLMCSAGPCTTNEEIIEYFTNIIDKLIIDKEQSIKVHHCIKFYKSDDEYYDGSIKYFQKELERAQQLIKKSKISL